MWKTSIVPRFYDVINLDDKFSTIGCGVGPSPVNMGGLIILYNA